MEQSINLAWNNLTEGEITITFYKQDIRGYIGTESIVVIKSIPKPAIPGYSLFFLFGARCLLSILIQKNIKKLN